MQPLHARRRNVGAVWQCASKTDYCRISVSTVAPASLLLLVLVLLPLLLLVLLRLLLLFVPHLVIVLFLDGCHQLCLQGHILAH